MALGLLDLPNEVLAEIFSYLDTTHLRPCNWDPDTKQYHGEEYTNCRPSLCAVTLVNRRLHHIARRVLLEDISLHVGSSGTKYPWMFEGAARFFAEDCIKFPAIIEHLRTFRIWWCAPTPTKWALDLFGTISLAPNLIELRIDKFLDHSNPSCGLEILQILVHRLRSLQVFVANIPDARIPCHLFLEICRMQYLRSFETDCPILAPGPTRGTAVDLDEFFGDVPKYHAQESRLERLRCNNQYVDLQVLRHVLLRSPQLKTLILSLPGPALGLYPFYGESFVPDSSEAVKRLFRPDLVSQMLMPCASNLYELTITNDFAPLKLTNDTFIDLSSFSQLRRLTLSNRLICKVTDQGMQGLPPDIVIELPAEDWYKCLPPGLEFFKLQLESAHGLLWNSIALDVLASQYNTDWATGDSEACARAVIGWHSDFEIRYFKPSVTEEIKDASFNKLSWIMELARDVSSKFRDLRTIKVVEDITVWLERSRRDCDLLDLVETYPEAFGCPGIDLELSVRVPSNYVPPPLETMKFVSIDDSSWDVAAPASHAELLRALEAQESFSTVFGRWTEEQSLINTATWGETDVPPVRVQPDLAS